MPRLGKIAFELNVGFQAFLGSVQTQVRVVVTGRKTKHKLCVQHQCCRIGNGVGKVFLSFGQLFEQSKEVGGVWLFLRGSQIQCLAKKLKVVGIRVVDRQGIEEADCDPC